MLTYLKVKNLAIVEELAIEPGPGLNVLTGETGAGKSLLIDSLGFLSGARGSTEVIRAGADKMTTEGVFHLPAAHAGELEALGVDVERDGDTIEIIVRREISSGGRGRVLINGSAVTVRDLVSAMERILEIHGQSEAHDRVAGKSHREVVDDFAGADELLEAVRSAHGRWKTLSADLEGLVTAHNELSLRVDLLRYQIDELSAAKLDSAEEELLRSEKAVLAHARELIASSSTAFSLLEDDENSAASQIARAEHALQPLTEAIPEIAKILEEIADARFRVHESARSLGHLADSTRHDPERLEAIEDRLVTIDRLRKKYGGSIGSALEHLDSITQEHDRLTDYDATLDKLRLDEKAAFEEYRSQSERLSAVRHEAAPRLEKAIQQELDDLAMERTVVQIPVMLQTQGGSRLEIGGHPVAFGPGGWDYIAILIAPNRGEEPKPMQRIASGGELSRIQLAVAAALFAEAKQTGAATLIFDEIDAGIGGRVAEAVGRKLRELAIDNQVVCVTHLPQIASLASVHFRVWKEDVGERTRARVERLDEMNQRIEEVARMLGGEAITDSARAHAADLIGRGQLAPARRRREKWTKK